MNQNIASCGQCGLAWDDSIATSYTPAPGARCPFEHFHKDNRRLRDSDIPNDFPVRPFRDNSQLHPKLLPLKGDRVECTRYGERVRFWVGQSTGWRPCLLAVHNARSHGGDAISVDEDLGEIRRIRSGPR